MRHRLSLAFNVPSRELNFVFSTPRATLNGCVVVENQVDIFFLDLVFFAFDFPLGCTSARQFKCAKAAQDEKFEVTVGKFEVCLMHLTRLPYDRAECLTLFMKKKLWTTNSEEHGVRGRLAPTALKGKISTFTAFMRQ
jgi:hypothetical protein